MSDYLIDKNIKKINGKEYFSIVCKAPQTKKVFGEVLKAKEGEVCCYLDKILAKNIDIENASFFPDKQNNIPIFSGSGDNYINLKDCVFAGDNNITLEDGCGLNVENAVICGKVDIFSEIGDAINIKNSAIVGNNISLKNSATQNYDILGEDITLKNADFRGIIAPAKIQGNSIDFLCDGGEFLNVNAIGDNISVRGNTSLENVCLRQGAYVNKSYVLGLGIQAITLSNGSSVSNSTLVGDGIFENCSLKNCNITFGDGKGKQKSLYVGSVFYNNAGEMPDNTKDSMIENCENVMAKSVENCELFGLNGKTFGKIQGEFISSAKRGARDKTKVGNKKTLENNF
ncbi:MAG: hypothetical protein IJ837_02570 [Clostridia bacterium]|nr:hypothetical protein [Clostridia bacterium]